MLWVLEGKTTHDQELKCTTHLIGCVNLIKEFKFLFVGKF